ncbi:MAG: phosphate signaling complex protein PhoU [Gammaproteobacteria bacterium]|jgi:phosphate transport system protein
MSDYTSHITEGHTVRSYDADLEELRTLALEMGGLTVDQIDKAVASIRDHDVASADEVIEREKQVNDYDTRAEEIIFNLLAKRQPMAFDLRVIMSYLRAVTDLERCGDEAKKIAKISRGHIRDGLPKVDHFETSVGNVGKLASELLKQAVEALDEADEEKAVSAAQADARLDAEYKVALRGVHNSLLDDPELIEQAADLVIVIKALERIGDHAKNIAKYVVFIVQGKDVRHVKTKVLDQEI